MRQKAEKAVIRGAETLRIVGTMEQMTLLSLRLFKSLPPENRTSFARDPDVVGWLRHEGEELYKALSPGGRAMKGLTPDDWAADVKEAVALAEEQVALLKERVQDHFQDFLNATNLRKELGDRPELLRRTQTEHRIKRDIGDAYNRLFELGKRQGGNMLLPTKAEKRLLMRMRRDEFLYLRNFLDDIEQGRGVMPYTMRVDLYANAASEAKWAGYVYADLSPDRYLLWAKASAEHCEDCIALSGELSRWGNGVYSVQEIANMAVFPQSGRLRCTTNCKCRLEDVQRPRGKPGKAFIRAKFESLLPKPPIRHRYESQKARWRTKREKRP